MRISNSGIQAFKSCRRMYELKYIYGLEPVYTSEALTRGSQYHELVEGILKGNLDVYKQCGDVKIKAMATAFEKYVMPYIPDAETVEEWFSYLTKSGHVIVGRIDGRLDNGEVVEHKTTSGVIDVGYFQKLDFDEQIMTYMTAMNTDEICYTVCAVPSIRQREHESEDEFYARCVNWFDKDTDGKIQVARIKRTKEELERFAEEQDAMVTEIENCKLFYRNPNNCVRWGRMCEYAPVCMNYDPNEEYIQFKRREDYYEKTGKAQV